MASSTGTSILNDDGNTEKNKNIPEVTKNDDLIIAGTKDSVSPLPRAPRVQAVKGPNVRVAAKLASARGLQTKIGEETEGTSSKSGPQSVNNYDARIAAKLASASKLQPGVQEIKNADNRIAAKLAASRITQKHPQETIKNNNREDKIAAKLASAGNSRIGIKSSDSGRRIDDRITAKLASNNMIVARSDSSSSNKTPVTPSRSGYFSDRQKNRSNRRLDKDNGTNSNNRTQALEMDNRIVAKLAANSVGSVRSSDSVSARSGISSRSNVNDLDQRINAKLSASSIGSNTSSPLASSNRSDPNGSTSNTSPGMKNPSMSGVLREMNTAYDQKIISKLKGNRPISNDFQELSQDGRANLERQDGRANLERQDGRTNLERPSISSNNISFRRRISDLATPHDDDLVENVYGERIDVTSRRILPVTEEEFEDHDILYTPTSFVNSENSRANSLHDGGGSSTYLSTRSVDVEDIQHEQALVSALHYSNFNSNNQQETKQEEEEAPYFRLKVFLILVIFAGIIAATVGVFASRKSSSPSTVPISSRQKIYQDMFNFISLQDSVNATLLKDPTSAQAQSFNWLVYNDSLELVPNTDEIIDHQIIQRYALMTIYYSVSDVRRKGLKWGAPESECQWEEKIIDCKKIQIQGGKQVDSVVKLIVNKRDLKGTLVNDTGLLSNLEYLSFSDNKIKPPLPEYIFTLSKLETLDLSENRLNSLIDERIGNLSNLRNLYLYECGLNGPLPNSITNSLTNLVNLELDRNKLSGAIFPWILRSNETIQSIRVQKNEFDTTIPTEIANLKNLKILDVAFNPIKGSIPTEIGTINTLEDLLLWYTQITGAIPSQIGNLVNLVSINLGNNKLSSTIPLQLGNLNTLTEINLSKNKITGPIPTEFGKLKLLTVLRLNGNFLSSVVPDIFQNLTLLKLLALQDNKLTGNMPSSVCDLTKGNLTELDSDCAVQCDCCTSECHD